MIKYFLFFLVGIIPSAIRSQSSTKHVRPLIVPFQVDGKWGMMDTLGREVKAPGFCSSVDVHQDFSYYIITDRGETYAYWIMNAQTGDRIDLGVLQDRNPLLKVGDHYFYRFEKDNKTVIASPATQERFVLDRLYATAKAYTLYDSKGENSRKYVVVYDNDGVGTIMAVADGFKRVDGISPFKKLETISVTIEEEYSQYTIPVGLALEEIVSKKPTIVTHPKQRKKGRQAKSSTSKLEPPVLLTPPEPVKEVFAEMADNWKANVYDYQLIGKGSVVTTDTALTSAFGAPAMLSTHIPAQVSMGGGIIKAGIGGNQGVELNGEFAIKQILKKVSEGTYREVYYLVKKANDQTLKELVSHDEARFDWAYNHEDQLISIRFYDGGNKVQAYFDYNGVVLPKDKLMIPAAYYTGTMSEFLIR